MPKTIIANILLILALSACATSFVPSETSTSLTKGPKAIPIVDSDDIRLQQLFIRGLTRAMVDDHRQAIFLFEQAIQLDGDHAAIHMALSESHAALDDLDSAVFYAREATKLNPSNRSYAIGLSDLLHRRGDLDQALAVLRDWTGQHPDDVDAFYKAADLLAESGRQEDALDIYVGLIDRQGDEMQIRYRMLQLYNGLGDLEGMRHTVRRMLHIDATNNSLRNLLAEVYVELDSAGAAIDLLEEAVADDPTDSNATLLLSRLYRETGREADADALLVSSSERSNGPADKMTLASDLYARSASDVLAAQRAEELLDQMIEEGIETPDVLYMLGDLRYRSAEYSRAAPMLLRAAEMEPRRVDAWSKAGLSFLKAGNFPRALEVAKEALVLFPGQYPILRVAGQSSLRTGRPEEAIDYAKSALEIIDGRGEEDGERIAEMLLLEAAGYRLLGVPEAAEHALREVLEVTPEHVEGRYWLIMSVLDQGGRADEARSLATSCLRSDADNVLFLDAMGWVEHAAGDENAALRWLTRAAEAGENDARVQEHLGDVYFAIGENESARIHWRNALALDPGRVALKAKLEQHP